VKEHNRVLEIDYWERRRVERSEERHIPFVAAFIECILLDDLACFAFTNFHTKPGQLGVLATSKPSNTILVLQQCYFGFGALVAF
jgi:hypothetical protein